METPLRESLRAGESIAGTWVSIGHPTVAELLAGVGFDFLVVDTEHAATSLETIENAVRAVEAASGTTTPIVRVPWNDPVRIKRVLDTGPGGLLVPMVESADEARAAVEAARYPPEGIRGIAASRANDYGRELAGAVEEGASDPVTIVQVETKKAVENAGEIGAVDGIDALLVGPADLSASLGVFGDWDDDAFEDAIETVLRAADDAGTPVGTLATSDAEIDRIHSLGFDYLVTGVDAIHLREGARRARERYESIATTEE